MNLITVLGPTAVGKTKLAVRLAAELNGEIISADSRQVYRKMDLGTGKDLIDYKFDNQEIEYHLIDIKEAGEKYDVYHFQRDFYAACKAIKKKGKQAILCGGSGLYLQAALENNSMVFVPRNEALREELLPLSQEELNTQLGNTSILLHNKTDLTDRDRTIRAIEIAKYTVENPEESMPSPIKNHLVIGLRMERAKHRNCIKVRMEERFNAGMLAEVERLIDEGVSKDTLHYYGLEYRYLLAYLDGKLEFKPMKEKLLQSIRQFAKKQMTWFRRMEKRGVKVHWLEAENGIETNVQQALTWIKNG